MIMKLKYYLRGLGTGIVVTALVLGISLSHGKGRMSDEEIKARATELGMVEEFKSLAEASKEKETKQLEEDAGVSSNEMADSKDTAKEETNPVKADDGGKPEKEASEQNTKETGEKEGGFGSSIENPEAEETSSIQETQDQPADTQEENTPDEAEETPQETGKSIFLEVRSGDGSLSVARKAEKAGLVADAAEFDRFLCSGGYDKRICTGKHEIPQGATMEEIAKLLIQKP